MLTVSQAQSDLKSERDEFEKQILRGKETEANWQSRHTELEKLHNSLEEQLSSVSTERDNLSQEKATLHSYAESRQSSIDELKLKLAQTASELATSVRALQQNQAELKAANRRADEAEKAQADLQAEGIGLMRSLEEMRPKIVELTDTKLDLGDRVENLSKAVRTRDDTILQLEGAIEELREKHSRADSRIGELTNVLTKERSTSDESTTELQRAYADIQKELEEARTSADTLGNERAEYRSMAAQRTQEVDRLSASVQAYTEQLALLKEELDERKEAEDSAHEVLERTRAEMEALRTELAAKDNEIDHLQQAVSPATPGSASLDEEMLSAMNQHHTLELSAAQSDIRSLETSVYEAEARALTLQRQVAALEDQLSHYRAAARNSPRPSAPARPSTRVVDYSDDLRRASFSSVRSGGLNRPTSPLSSFEGLTAETRHRRRVSLGMLKARIDSEAAAARSHPPSRQSPAQKVNALPTVVEPSSGPGTPRAGSPQQRKTQFLDDSHVFWCHSCRGDLVIL